MFYFYVKIPIRFSLFLIFSTELIFLWVDKLIYFAIIKTVNGYYTITDVEVLLRFSNCPAKSMVYQKVTNRIMRV